KPVLGDLRAAPYADGLRLACGEAGFRQGTAAPVDVDLDSASGSQPAHAALRPSRRQGGQKVDLTGVTLQQHLGDPRRRAEVAVDLEGRMGVEEVGVDAAAARVVGGRAPRRLEQVGE